MTEGSFDPGPLAEVERQSDGARWTLVFVRDLPHPPERVWGALTEPAQLREWSPYTADRNLDVAGEAVLTMLDADAPEELSGTVTRAERPSLLEHACGTDVLRWELAPTGAGTRLTLLHTTDDGDALPKAAAGWHLCLAVADRLLAGRPVPPVRGEKAMSFGWEDLHEAYAGALEGT
jgi:uncharacterized protein YndB with AHSA1/START domain